MKFLFLFGPNLNLLGLREPQIYGHTGYAELCDRIRSYCAARGVEAVCFQSNHEGALIDAIHEFRTEGDGIIINAGAYTHTSIALLDALLAVGMPAVEVHLSDPAKREEFRRVSYLRAACLDAFCGLGPQGYDRAIDRLLTAIQEQS